MICLCLGFRAGTHPNILRFGEHQLIVLYAVIFPKRCVLEFKTYLSSFAGMRRQARSELLEIECGTLWASSLQLIYGSKFGQKI